MSKQRVIISSEKKADILVSKVIINFSLAVLILLASIIFTSVFSPLENFINTQPLLFLVISSVASIASIVLMIIMTMRSFFEDLSAKYLRNSWWSFVALTSVSLSLWISILSGQGVVELTSFKFAYVFVVPTLIMLIGAFLVRYSQFDFTKLRIPLFFASLFFAISGLIFFITRSEIGDWWYYALIVLYVGFIIYDISIIKKHAEFLRVLKTPEEEMIGEESLKFVYLYCANLFLSFTRIIRLLLILMARNR